MFREDDLQDTLGSDGLLPRILFGHIRPFGADPPLCLSTLQLRGIDLSFCNRTYAKCIDYNILRALHVKKCRGTEYLLTALANSFPKEGCALQELSLDIPDDINCELEAFLKSWTGLKGCTIRTGRASCTALTTTTPPSRISLS